MIIRLGLKCMFLKKMGQRYLQHSLIMEIVEVIFWLYFNNKKKLLSIFSISVGWKEGGGGRLFLCQEKACGKMFSLCWKLSTFNIN